MQVVGSSNLIKTLLSEGSFYICAWLDKFILLRVFKLFDILCQIRKLREIPFRAGTRGNAKYLIDLFYQLLRVGTTLKIKPQVTGCWCCTSRCWIWTNPESEATACNVWIVLLDHDFFSRWLNLVKIARWVRNRKSQSDLAILWCAKRWLIAECATYRLQFKGDILVKVAADDWLTPRARCLNSAVLCATGVWQRQLVVKLPLFVVDSERGCELVHPLLLWLTHSTESELSFVGVVEWAPLSGSLSKSRRMVGKSHFIVRNREGASCSAGR